MGTTRRTIATLLTIGTIGVAATLSTAAIAAAAGPKTLKVWLVPTGTDTNAWGKAKYTFNKKGGQLKVVTHNLTLGAYSVQVSGVEVGAFTVALNAKTGKKAGKFMIDSRHAGAVSIDPRGASLAVVSQTTGAPILGADRFPTSKLDQTQSTELEIPFLNTGVQLSAEGEAKFKDCEGRQKFKVEVEGLAAGTYDLIVGGITQAEIEVDAEGEGEVSFDSVPVGSSDDEGEDDQNGDGTGDDDQGDDDQGDDDQGDDDQGDDDQGDDDQGDNVAADQNQEDGDGDLLLTFDPRGQEILVSQSGVAILQIVLFQ